MLTLTGYLAAYRTDYARTCERLVTLGMAHSVTLTFGAPHPAPSHGLFCRRPQVTAQCTLQAPDAAHLEAFRAALPPHLRLS